MDVMRASERIKSDQKTWSFFPFFSSFEVYYFVEFYATDRANRFLFFSLLSCLRRLASSDTTNIEKKIKQQKIIIIKMGT